jgi:phosphoserine aminotransferase
MMSVKQLKLKDVRVIEAGYGALPDLSLVDPSRDVVFTLNGTTSGVASSGRRVDCPDREGLSICDATQRSIRAATALRQARCRTFSWQKVLGGERRHGMLILSPRAVERRPPYFRPGASQRSSA